MKRQTRGSRYTEATSPLFYSTRMSALSESMTEASNEATLNLTESMIEEDNFKFKPADWAVFCLMLVASICIGIVSALRDRRKATIQDYLLGGGNMPPLAVGLSLMGGWVSAISILGKVDSIIIIFYIKLIKRK